MSRQIVLDESLQAQLVESPAPGVLDDDQVRVRVVLAGVNYWEVMQRQGRVPLPGRIPGTEGVGVVEDVGAAVDSLPRGTRVAWSRLPGSWAEVVTAPAKALVPVPDGVPDDAAASVLFQGLTAHYLCHDTWPLESGDTAIVTAAAGGVGQLLTQLLVAAGVRVLGVVSSEAKSQAARSAGASAVLHYGDDVSGQALALAPGGVAAVFDAIGAGVAEPLIGSLRPRGAMVLYGSSSGQEAQIAARDLSAGSLYLTRTAGRDYLGDADALAARSSLLLDLVARAELQPAIGATYPLAEAGRALDDLESRTTVGKLLLRP